MKIIFLDIDGVLKTKNGLRRAFKKFKKLVPDILDEFAVKNLNNLIKETNAGLVMTSTWRYGESIESIHRILSKQGVEGNVVGMTPELGQFKEQSFSTVTRGEEIQEWLKRNGEPVDYVILDDDPNILQQQTAHFVKCDSEDGFANETRYHEAVAILQSGLK